MDPTVDYEAEALFENAPFGSTRAYLNALSKKRASLCHRVQIIMDRSETTKSHEADRKELVLMKKQITDLDEELKGYDHRKGSRL